MVGRGRHLDATKIMYESGSSPKGREVVALGLKFGPPFFIANLSKTNAEPKKARWTLCGGNSRYAVALMTCVARVTDERGS